MSDFQEIFYIAVGILSAITIHECAHAWVADKLGDDTAKMEGRVTLNPLAHLDFFGTLMFIFVHFGWGKPVPVNASNFKNPWKDSILVSIAGPLSNFLLAIFLSIFLRIFVAKDIYDGYFFFLVSYIFYTNISLGVFNLLPFPPLDGSKIFQLFVPLRYRENYYRFLNDGVKYFMLFILLDIFLFPKVLGYSIVRQILTYVINFLVSVILIGS
ncbi:MAG: peptidase M50 [Candidatus Peregrinibacteria bacterium GW2011_GWC2_33_13]|nr:MAG: peptidase M50 [Candidatus Peregrinibacteria bacterium GW2011_GWC2_33_13]